MACAAPYRVLRMLLKTSLLLMLAPGMPALQLISDVPANFPAIGGQKHVVTLRERGVTSKADAEELAQLNKDAQIQHMISADGRKFTCRIPSRVSQPTDSALLIPDPTSSSGAGSSLEEEGPSALDLLGKMNSLCLYRQEGLWTYEMCFKKHTRQFRQAMQRIVANAQPETISAEDFLCGKYDQVQDLSIKQDFSSTGMSMNYISHNMTGGAPCILTNAPRTSEVRFTCMPHARDNLLVMVKEFPTCNYIYVVATPFLCTHPKFRPPPQRTHTLRCDLEQPDGEVETDAFHTSPPPAVEAAVAIQGAEGECHVGDKRSTCSASDQVDRDEAAAE